MFFDNKPKLIYKGKLNRTTKDHTAFMVAHNDKKVYMLPEFSEDEIVWGKGHLDHDMQMVNLEQLLNRMIIDNGSDYTINKVLDLLKTIR